MESALIKYRIKENSLLARISAFNLGKPRCAIVIDKTIFLWGISKAEFLTDEPYLKHELKHIAQYRDTGILRFLFLYIYESIKNGYYMNRFEIEARDAEQKAMPPGFELS
jgi:hypothetical protein